LLPFARKKRASRNDEVELGEDDFELVDVLDDDVALLPAPARLAANVVAASPRNADQAKTVQRASRPRTILPVSRRILDENVEEDVAGQCLASIAAETSRDAIDSGHSSSQIRAALGRPQPTPPRSVTSAPAAPTASTPASTTRLPSVIAPPFLRTTTSTVPFRGYNDAPGVRDSSPPPAFVRRSSPVLLAAVPAAAPSSYVAAVAASSASSVASAGGTSGSVAPVSMPMTQRHEPTVIVVRERPRAAWIIAAAAMGALGALGAMRFVAPPAAAALEVRSTAVAAPQAAPTTEASVIAPVVAPSTTDRVAAVAPVASVASSTAGLPPAIVHFGDDDGVAFKSPARRSSSPAAPSAPAAPVAPPVAPGIRSTGPRAPSMGPALPDGSFGLGRSDTATTASAPPPAPALTASVAPEAPRKRALTPEQQLAAAQLKASMK
jgi:hypothetical protein